MGFNNKNRSAFFVCFFRKLKLSEEALVFCVAKQFALCFLISSISVSDL